MTCDVQPKIGKPTAGIFYSLLSDLDLASSLLKTARLMPSGQKQLYESHALKIHQDVSGKTQKMHMPPDTRRALNHKLLLLSTQLPVLAQVFAGNSYSAS